MMELDERGAGYAGSAQVQPRTTTMMAPRSHLVSWGAILAGAAVAIMVGVMLNTLGAATVAGMVDTTARDSASVTTFSTTTALWFAGSIALGLLAGGYVAARLLRVQDKTIGLLHGAGVWAVAFVVAVGLVGSAASGVSVAVLRGAGTAAAGAVGAVTEAAGSGASEALVQRLRGTVLAPTDIAAAPREEAIAEAGQLLAARVRGEWTPAQRQRLEALVASLASVPQPVAVERVAEAERAMLQAARTAEETARRAADTAASAGSAAAMAAFATMLLGLLAAVVGAAAGHRPMIHADTLRTSV